jgi:hypothetical protein
MDIVELLKSNLQLFLQILVALPAILIALWKIISKTEYFIKLRTEVRKYYLLGKERKFLILSRIFLVVGIVLIAFFIIYYIHPPQSIQTNNYVYYPMNLVGGGGGVFNVVSGMDAVLIDRNQIFHWARIWNEYFKPKDIILTYSTQGTVIRIGGLNNDIALDYGVSGNSTLYIQAISIPYNGITITNIGNAPFYLFSIKETEEDTQQSNEGIFLVFGFYSLLIAYFLNKRHKEDKRRTPEKPFDLLIKDAKLADKIEYIQIESENCENMLNYLEVLKQQGKLSEKYYVERKSYFENYRKELSDEKGTISSEIEEIKSRFNKK